YLLSHKKGLQALIKRPLKRPLCYNNPAHNVPKQIGHPITVRPLKETNRLRQFAPELYITASL
ncbi:hypothetical protein, partial [Agrobacterium tumefaciens]|uniref:hypothetical protein n=1 Tax=Agrobacterium tumefaciens TaxID=358 RepID=UPI001AEC7720